ncbi:MAG: YciI family protein [Chloroflexota bacterium]
MSEKNLYLYKIEPTRPEMLTEGGTPEEDQIMGEHFLYLKEKTADGTIFLAGPSFRGDGSGMGITIFEAANDEDAAAFMNGDPAVQKGVMKAEWLHFRLSLLGHVNSDHVINDLRS